MELTRDPHLGLSAGRAMGPPAFHLLGLIALACATLPEALATGARAYPGASVRFPLLESCGDGRTRFGMPAHDAASPGARCEAELAAVLLHDVLLHFLSPETPAPDIEFAFAAPPDLTPYRRAFSGNITFGADGTFVTFPDAALMTRRSGADALLKDQLLRLARQHYGSPTEEADSWSARVRLVLRAHRAPRLIDAEFVASQLELSARGLARRLARDGTSLSALMDAELFERAKSLLNRPGATAAQVASALGYAELSSFFRAFRRWSGGLTPSAFRRESEP